jgi:hypothetical protein
MVGRVRRLGIALGSLVAASLVVGLVGGAFLPLIGVGPVPTTDPLVAPANRIVTLVTVVLGALVYRDIIRREQPAADGG